MPLDEIDRAWVRFVALRDQLLAARDDENRRRRGEALPLVAELQALDEEIDLREPLANQTPYRRRLSDRDPR